MTTIPAQAYREAYIKGIEVAIEFIELYPSNKEAVDALKNMVNTLQTTNTEEE